MTDATSGASIYYTLDGSTPTTSSSTVTSGGTVSITQSQTLKAKAFLTGLTSSDVASETYQVTGKIAAAQGLSMALKSDGTVWRWGSGAAIPAHITGLSNVIDIAPGLVVLANGTVWTTDGTQVSGLSNIVSISPDGSPLAINSSGTVYTWDGSSAPTAFAAGTLTGVTSVATGNGASLAVDGSQTVWAWGFNGYGQLGTGDTTNSSVPVQIAGLTDVTAVAVGVTQSLALKSDGTVWAWGGNWNGELGTGDYNSIYTPVQVAGLTNVVAIAAGNGFSVAVKSDGTVWAWGGNEGGVLGTDSISTSPSPVQIGPFSNPGGGVSIISVAAGDCFVLALGSDGTIWAWGAETYLYPYTNYGELGNGATTGSLTPLMVGMRLVPHAGGANQDGIPDSWGMTVYGLSSITPYGDPWGNGKTNLQMYLQGITPLDYPYWYMTKESDDFSTYVSVWDWGNFTVRLMNSRTGLPVAGQPVTFSAGGYGWLMNYVTTDIQYTNNDGYASDSYQDTVWYGASDNVTASSPGIGVSFTYHLLDVVVTFNPPSGAYDDPFSLSVINPAGSWMTGYIETEDGITNISGVVHFPSPMTLLLAWRGLTISIPLRRFTPSMAGSIWQQALTMCSPAEKTARL